MLFSLVFVFLKFQTDTNWSLFFFQVRTTNWNFCWPVILKSTPYGNINIDCENQFPSNLYETFMFSNIIFGHCSICLDMFVQVNLEVQKLSIIVSMLLWSYTSLSSFLPKCNIMWTNFTNPFLKYIIFPIDAFPCNLTALLEIGMVRILTN